jgi:peroxiredoxin
METYSSILRNAIGLFDTFHLLGVPGALIAFLITFAWIRRTDFARDFRFGKFLHGCSAPRRHVLPPFLLVLAAPAHACLSLVPLLHNSSSRKYTRARRFLNALAILQILHATCALAANPKIEPRAEELARKMIAPLASAKSLEVDLKVTVDLMAKTEAPANYSLAIARPNKIALVLKDGVIGASIYSDGTNATTFVPMMNRYVVMPSKKTISAVLMDAGAVYGDASSLVFLAALFDDKPYESLVAGVIEATYGGLEIVQGVQLQRVNFKQEGVAWSLLMTTNATPSLRRIEVDVSKLHADAAKMAMDFNNWKFNEPIASDRFNFVPPKDARKVDAFFDGDSDLIGEKLPAFKLRSIDGKEWNSSAWKGAPAILVFWQGEEEHTLKALQALSELAGASKNVKFYAINLDEQPDKEKLKSLYAKNKIALPTALDPAHTAADQLEVDGVPMTFLIDKEGVIRNAFLGHHPDFKDIVAKEIKTLSAPK